MTQLYQYADLEKEVNKLFSKYGFDYESTPLFEHTLLLMAGIRKFSSRCRVGNSKNNPEIFYLHTNLSEELAQQFIDAINSKYGINTAKRNTEQDNLIRTLHPTIAISIDLETTLTKILPKEFKDTLDKRMSDPHTVLCYRAAASYLTAEHENMIRKLESIGSPFNVNGRSNFIEASLLRALNIKSELKSARFEKAKRYDGFASDTDFFLGISFQDARKVVQAINQKFPAPESRIIAQDIPHIFYTFPVQHIAIPNGVLASQEFRDLLKTGLEYIAQNEPDLLENFQVESGTRKKEETSLQMASRLDKIAQNYKDWDGRLASTLTQFSVVIQQHKSKTELQVASDEVDKSVAAHQANIPTENYRTDYSFFKKTAKKEIKEIQQVLGTREVSTFQHS